LTSNAGKLPGAAGFILLFALKVIADLVRFGTLFQHVAAFFVCFLTGVSVGALHQDSWHDSYSQNCVCEPSPP